MHIKEKRILTWLLAMLMMLSLIPAAAFADDAGDADGDTGGEDTAAAAKIIIDGVDVTEKTDIETLKDDEGNYYFSKLDLSDADLFTKGAADAYLVTLGDETKLVGDTTLKQWSGNWETWQSYIYPDDELLAKMPLLESVWDTAYDSYIAVFEAAGMGDFIKAQYPNTEALKKYWYDMTDTKGANNIAVTGDSDSGYVLQWKDSDGNVLASDSYTMTGKMLKGLEGATMYIFTADTLADGSGYKYWITMAPDMEGDTQAPIAAHYHYQFGSDIDSMTNYGQLYNGTASNIADKYWYATMINEEASDLAKYNVILGMHRAEKWSEIPELPETGDNDGVNGGDDQTAGADRNGSDNEADQINQNNAGDDQTVQNTADTNVRTGDDTNLILWIALMLSALGGIGALIIRRKHSA